VNINVLTLHESWRLDRTSWLGQGKKEETPPEQKKNFSGRPRYALGQNPVQGDGKSPLEVL